MMQIWLGRSPPRSDRPSAVSIGNFDGVHLGHRQILQRLHGQAAARGLAATALVFEPQPLEFFARRGAAAAPPRLTPLREKLQRLAQTGLVERVWVLRFDEAFAALTAQQFVDGILRGRLDTRYLLVGDDFRFGRGREGDFRLLSEQGAFVTEDTPTITRNGGRISSTLIRGHLAAGRIAEAEALLGQAYTLGGRVKHGAKLGRLLGCPTANIRLPPHRYALSGVFVVEAEGCGWRRHGVASFGTNPTVSDTPEAKLEVHLFDFSGDVYGQRLNVRFLHKLRDEYRFAGVDELAAQIARDKADAQAWLASAAALR